MKRAFPLLLLLITTHLVLGQTQKVTSTTKHAKKSTVKKVQSKAAAVSAFTSRTLVSTSVISSSINATPAFSTTTVSTSVISQVITASGSVNATATEAAVKVNERTAQPVGRTLQSARAVRSSTPTPNTTDQDKEKPDSILTVTGPRPTTVVTGDRPQLSVSTTQQSGQQNGTTDVIRRLIPQVLSPSVAETENCKIISNDALLIYNLCSGGPCGGSLKSALQLRLPAGDKRKWKYFKATDNVRMQVVSINPSSCTVVLNTLGLQNDFVVDQSPLQHFTLTPSTSPASGSATGAPTPSVGTSGDSQIADEVKVNQQTIAAYTVALREARRTLMAQPCITNEEIIAQRDGILEGETISRVDLQARQRLLIPQLSDVALRKSAEEGLTALFVELDQWAILLAGTTIRGHVMPARDKDYIQFVIKQRCGTGAEETLSPIEIPVYGNFRLNMSTGFLVSGLVDYKYLAIDRGVFEASFPTANTTVAGSTTVITESTLVNAPLSSTSTSTKVPIQEVPSLVNIGIGVLLHAYYTWPWAKGYVTPALSFGASLNSSGRYTLMVGGSVILGSKQRIVLTGGYALGPVTRLQEPFSTEARQEKMTVGQVETNRTVRTAYEFSGSEFPTTTRTEGSWFAGITFNISSKRNPILN